VGLCRWRTAAVLYNRSVRRIGLRCLPHYVTFTAVKCDLGIRRFSCVGFAFGSYAALAVTLNSVLACMLSYRRDRGVLGSGSEAEGVVEPGRQEHVQWGAMG